MAGPWEKYQQQDTQKPWEKYGAPPPDYAAARPGIQPPAYQRVLGGTYTPPRSPDIIGPSGGPGRPGEYEASSPLTPGQALKESGRAIGMGVANAVPALATGGGSLLGEMALYSAGGAADTALAGGTPKETAISGAVGAGMPVVGRAVGPLVSGIGKVAGNIANRIDPDVAGMFSPRLAHIRNVASKTARLAAKYGPQAAEEAAPSLTEQMSAPTPPGSATWQRPLPMPESGPPGAPTASAARPSLSEQMESAQPERRVSQQPYTGPNRRIAPEERGFLTAPPLDPERIGVDYRPAEDLGIKVRQETEAAKGPIKRGAKALKQAEALGKPAKSSKLIQAMGGQPVETITGERPPYVPLGFREGPPPGTTVPQSSEETQAALDMSLRRARRKLQ